MFIPSGWSVAGIVIALAAVGGIWQRGTINSLEADLAKQRASYEIARSMAVNSAIADHNAKAKTTEAINADFAAKNRALVGERNDLADRLRERIDTAPATSHDCNAQAQPGADGERIEVSRDVLGEGAGLAEEADRLAQRLGAKVDALQRYIENVCVAERATPEAGERLPQVSAGR